MKLFRTNTHPGDPSESKANQPSRVERAKPAKRHSGRVEVSFTFDDSTIQHFFSGSEFTAVVLNEMRSFFGKAF